MNLGRAALAAVFAGLTSIGATFSEARRPRDPAIYRTARKFQRELVARERAATDRMVRLWREAEKGIRAELARVAGTIENEGETAWRAFNRDRLRTLLIGVEARIEGFASTAYRETLLLQRLNVEAGTESVRAMLTASQATGWTLLPAEAIVNAAGFLSDGSPLATLFADIAPTAVDKAADTFVASLAQGENPRVIARRLVKAINAPSGLIGGEIPALSRDRALLIARTETLRSYRLAQNTQYRQNRSVVSGWRWLCARNPRTCIACLAMDGTVHELDETMGSHPGCRCTSVPILIYGDLPMRETAEEWFVRQPESVKLGAMNGSKERLRLYEAGEVPFARLATPTTSEKWGAGVKITTIRDLKGG